MKSPDKRDFLSFQFDFIVVEMVDRLPSLTSLRAFEAAARHMSFQNAAHELNITAGALSFQIKALEEHLGAKVFVRLNRSVELSEVGKALYPRVQSGFEELQTAYREAKRVLGSSTLTITSGPAFASKWLAPRMFDFTQENPGIELRFSASNRILDFDRDGIDVSIRFGYGPDEGCYSEPIAQDWLTPVMSPLLARKFRTPDSMKSAQLLHDDSIAYLKPACDWHAWFRAASIHFEADHGARFNQGDHAIDAAVSGAGVLLGRGPLIQRELRDGLLEAPFSIALTTKAHFRFVCKSGHQERPMIQTFLSWMKRELVRSCRPETNLELVPVESLQG